MHDIQACVKVICIHVYIYIYTKTVYILYLCVRDNRFINGAIQELVNSEVPLRIAGVVSWLNPFCW